MIFLIVTNICLLVISAYLGYRIWYLAGIIADLQDQDDDVVSYVQSLEDTNQFMYEQIKKSYENMQEIDRLGAFEAEDEAGTTFQLLNDVIIKLKEQFDVQEETK